MNQQEFAALAAQGYNRIPVTREVLADLETPVSTYRKLAEGPYSYFFESVQGGEKIATAIASLLTGQQLRNPLLSVQT